MEDMKKAANCLAADDVAQKDSLKNAFDTLYSEYIILKKAINVKEKKLKTVKKELNLNSTVRTLNLKFYPEQLADVYMTYDEYLEYYYDLCTQFANVKYRLANGQNAELLSGPDEHKYDYLFDRLKEAVEKFDKDFQVLYAVHDKDAVADPEDFFKVANIKSHIHLVVRRANGQPFKVSSILKALGISFRYLIDNDLWRFAVTTCRNFAASVAYLTHETENAKVSGKYQYDRSIIVSNCSESAIDDFREGYILVNEKRKITAEELVVLDKKFYDWGYELKDYDILYNSLHFTERSNPKIKTIKESYQRGIAQRLAVDPPDIIRTCIFITGGKNTGKTTSVDIALKELGYKVYNVDGGGTGKFDNLKISHTALVLDDAKMGNLLNMADDRICQAYRRQSNNPYWAGTVLVVTSNEGFLEWCKNCGLQVFEKKNVGTTYNGNPIMEDTRVPNEHGRAMLSRFFRCTVRQLNNGINQVFLDDDSMYQMKLSKR